jgi:hypothetical protein
MISLATEAQPCSPIDPRIRTATFVLSEGCNHFHWYPLALDMTASSTKDRYGRMKMTSRFGERQGGCLTMPSNQTRTAGAPLKHWHTLQYNECSPLTRLFYGAGKRRENRLASRDMIWDRWIFAALQMVRDSYFFRCVDHTFDFLFGVPGRYLRNKVRKRFYMSKDVCIRKFSLVRHDHDSPVWWYLQECMRRGGWQARRLFLSRRACRLSSDLPASVPP